MYSHIPEGYTCPFCLLIRGMEDERVLSVRTDVVYHDARVTAFIGAHQWPNNPGNVIVVPNAHYENLFDLPVGYAEPLLALTKQVALALKAVYGCDGISTRQHNEPAGNQDVWHYHVHVTPRDAGDHFYSTRPALMPVAERAGIAQKIREYLEREQGPITPMSGSRLATEIEKDLLLTASRKRAERLKVLVDIIGKLGSTLDRDQILAMIIDYAHQALDAEACSLFLLDEKSGQIVLHMASNMAHFGAEQVSVPLGKGIIGHVVQTGETVRVTDTDGTDHRITDPRHYNLIDRSSGFVTRSLLAVPLRSRTVALGGERGVIQERIIGGFEAVNKLAGTFDEEDAILLETLANQAATVLQVVDLYSDTQDLFMDVVKALTASIDAKDPYTEGHSERVAEYSVAVARQMGLDPEVIHRIRLGGMLHDVGKIGVPDDILKKPGALTAEETVEMKRHPFLGEKIMGQVRSLRTELPAISEHHEHLDGTGYPHGLRNSEISIVGRIVAVADVFDAMTSDRPYRAGLPPQQVFEHMRAYTGTYFAADCVNALIQAYQTGEIRTQKEGEK